MGVKGRGDLHFEVPWEQGNEREGKREVAFFPANYYKITAHIPRT